MNKKTWMSVLTAAALFMTVGSASLRADSLNQIRANIPFGFMVGSEAFAAGSYTVARVDNSPDVLVLRSSDGEKSAIFLTIGGDLPKAGQQARLVFNRYGDQYFVKEVWSFEDVPGRQLVPSSRERELSTAITPTPSQASPAREVSSKLGITVSPGKAKRNEGEHVRNVTFASTGK